jgi:hypothetical protein
MNTPLASDASMHRRSAYRYGMLVVIVALVIWGVWEILAFRNDAVNSWKNFRDAAPTLRDGTLLMAMISVAALARVGNAQGAPKSVPRGKYDGLELRVGWNSVLPPPVHQRQPERNRRTRSGFHA